MFISVLQYTKLSLLEPWTNSAAAAAAALQIFTLQSSTDNLKQKTVCGQGSVFRTLDWLDKCCKMG